MKKLLLALALALLPSLAWGQGAGGQQITCGKTAQGSSGAATTLIVPAVTPNPAPYPGQIIALCGWDVTSTGAATVQLVYGTGATCGTGTVAITAAHNFGANSGISSTNRGYSTPATNPAQGLCVVVTGTGPVQWTVYYAQY